MGDRKTLATISSLIAVAALAAAVIFFTQSRAAQSRGDELADSLNRAEKELIYYKNTDLAKEAELLQLQLKNTAQDLEAAEKKASTLETNLNSVRPHSDAVAAIEQFLHAPMTASNLANIDEKIAALQDGEITSQWQKARAGIGISKNSWSVSELVDTIFLINSRISSLVKFR